MKYKYPIIIAEIGVNHNGNKKTLNQLIEKVSSTGVDYIKFQTFKAEKLVSKVAEKANYQKNNFNELDNTQFNMLKNLELNETDHHSLIEYCDKKNIKFFSTAFDNDGLDFLNSLNMDFFKIPSGEITNYPYLKKLSYFNKPIILSTGMSNMEEINSAIEILCSGSISIDDIIVLHCNTEYPTPMNDVNLLAMLDIKTSLKLKNIGYSDHTLGIEIPIAAVSLGAKVIEKHFTLDRNMNGPDHAASLEPNELINMVKAIRNIELAIGGDGLKKPTKSELKNRFIARKSIHLNTKVKKGDVIIENMLIPLRPGDGISPMEIRKIIGQKFKKDLDSFTKLKFDDFE